MESNLATARGHIGAPVVDMAGLQHGGRTQPLSGLPCEEAEWCGWSFGFHMVDISLLFQGERIFKERRSENLKSYNGSFMKCHANLLAAIRLHVCALSVPVPKHLAISSRFPEVV